MLISAAVIAVFAGVKLWPVVRIFLSALLIAYLLVPVKSRLERFMPKTLSIAACFFALLIGFAALVLLIFIPALSEMKHLPAYLEKGIASFESVLGKLGGDVDFAKSIQNAFRPNADRIYKTLISGVGNIASFFVNFMAVLALTWFLLSDWEQLSLRMILFVPSFCRGKVISALTAIRRDLGGYLRAQGVIIALVSVMTIAVLFVIGTPIPLAMGLMYGLLNAIPYFGPLIGLIPPVLSAFSVSVQSALFTFFALLIVQQIDNYVLSPRVMGEVSGAGPVSVLIAVSAGSALGGVIGMFLALPVLIAVRAVYHVFTTPSY